MSVVRVPTLLLPRADVDLQKWTVIACDQFTSQPDYWDEVEALVGDAPSTLRMVIPELYLGQPDVDERIARCRASMEQYLAEGVLEERHGIVHVERTVSGGIQRGLLVELDLDAYDFQPDATTPVRSTEGTVLERIPPRMAVRRGAALELPHILVLFDDPAQSVLAPVVQAWDTLEVAYDVELMQGSGHVTGRLITDEALQSRILGALDALMTPDAQRERYGFESATPLQFAMGDGNHSLATAKATWEELKASGAGDDHPARWALVELVNLHDTSLQFEPIHRVVFGGKPLADDVVAAVGGQVRAASGMDELVEAVRAGAASGDAEGAAGASGRAQQFGMVSSDGFFLVEVPEPTHQLAVGTLQDALDRALADSDAEIDYVHGEDVVADLGRRAGNVGFVLPAIGKDSFFRSIALDGPLPRKTFSMGHAADKRFYMECRNIR